MASKTISLSVPAYEKLVRARRWPTESFSQVVLRATWREDTITAAELLGRVRTEAPFFEGDELGAIEALKESDAPPAGKWQPSQSS